MEPSETVKQVYLLLSQQDLGASTESISLARAGLERAQGPERLALAEGLTHALDALLTELGEHGRGNEALWGIALADLDVARLTAEGALTLKEMLRLRESGLSSESLIEPFVRGWMFPIGAREWLNQQRRAVAHRDAEWVARVSALLASPHPE